MGDSANLRRVATALQRATKVSFLTGAGVSVAAGIPDFRSPGGMYDTLRPELLTATERQRSSMAAYPEYVVSWDLFSENQFPYLELRRPFILGIAESKWKPTLAHHFMGMCHAKNKLQRIFTQNIDGLDTKIGVPDGKMTSVHGSIGQIRCEFCTEPYPADQFCQDVRTNIKDIYGIDPDAPKESSEILCPKCNEPGLKPNTVLYGSSLPADFFRYLAVDLPSTEVLFVMGTSLTVSPANRVPHEVSRDCLRVFVDRDNIGRRVGATYTEASRDIWLEGSCDDVVCGLIKELQWGEDALHRVDDMSDSARAMVLEAFGQER